MAFDEVGQADTQARKVEICTRAYDLLVGDGFPPEDIIFDPNIFAIATGIDEHKNYAVDFIEASREIRARCPGAHIFGRPVQPVVQLSAATNPCAGRCTACSSTTAIRPARHGDRQAGQLDVYDQIDPGAARSCEDVISTAASRPRTRAPDRAASFAAHVPAEKRREWRGWPGVRAARARAGQGIDALVGDTEEAASRRSSADPGSSKAR
jgi:5-methyltetrahydrofolate--homocysteine methyltransferase